MLIIIYLGINFVIFVMDFHQVPAKSIQKNNSLEICICFIFNIVILKIQNVKKIN